MSLFDEVAGARPRSAPVEGVECPACGGGMAERTNRYTTEKFLGCLAYPRCTGTIDPGAMHEPSGYWSGDLSDLDDETPVNFTEAWAELGGGDDLSDGEESAIRQQIRGTRTAPNLAAREAAARVEAEKRRLPGDPPLGPPASSLRRDSDTQLSEAERRRRGLSSWNSRPPQGTAARIDPGAAVARAAKAAPKPDLKIVPKPKHVAHATHRLDGQGPCLDCKRSGAALETRCPVGLELD